MDPTLAIALVTAMLGVGVLAGVAVEYVLARRAVHRSLRLATWDDPEIAEVRARELAAPATSRLVVPTLNRLGRFARRLAPASIIQRLDDELLYGGGSATWDGSRVLALKVVLALALALLGWLLAVVAGVEFLWGLAVTVGFGIIGYYLPEWILRSRASSRQTSLRRALPDALDLMSITVEAGLGFDAALDRVAREIRGPLGGEFYRVVQEMRLGRSRADALRALADRSNIPELRSFVLAMIQADIFGVSVARVLRVQADEMRVKRRQRAEEEAQKLPVKIIFPLILCIFPAVFTVLLGPAAIRIYENIFLSQ